MIRLTSREKEILKKTIEDFNKEMIQVYDNKPAVRKFVVSKGFSVPNDGGIDDELYETITRLDHVENHPEEVDSLPHVLRIGVLQFLDKALPEGSEGDPLYNDHFVLMAKLYNIPRINNLINNN